jgi:hypothetical protein
VKLEPFAEPQSSLACSQAIFMFVNKKSMILSIQKVKSPPPPFNVSELNLIDTPKFLPQDYV